MAVPPFNNPPIEPQFYQPSQFFISAISLGQTTTITTTEDMNYVIGQQVRILINQPFGCRQLSGQTGLVISIPAPNQVILNINSVGYDPLISSSATTKPQILAIGDINTGAINSFGRVDLSTTVPGAYINISPG
jgi:hypothetical protein